MQVLCDFIAQVLAAAPNNFGFLLLAASGALLAERAGLGVLCLEAFATLGAAVGACAAMQAGWGMGAIGGLALGAFAGALAGTLHWFFVQIGRVDAVVNAIVLNLLAPGGALFIAQWSLGREQFSPVIEAPLQVRAPLGTVAFCLAAGGVVLLIWATHRRAGASLQKWLRAEVRRLVWGVSLIIVPAAAWFGQGAFQVGLPVHLLLGALSFPVIALALQHGRPSRWIAASGQDANEAALAGIPVRWVRVGTGVVCGALCGLAGAGLVLGNVNSFAKGVVADRGYLAVAAVILGGWRLQGVALACLALSLFPGAQTQLQATTLGTALPFALPFLAVVGYLLWRGGRIQIPSELMRPVNEPPTSIRFRIGVVLARGPRRDASVNQYVLSTWRLFGGTEVRVSMPFWPGNSLERAQRLLKKLSWRHSHIVGIGSLMREPFGEFAARKGEWPRLAIIDEPAPQEGEGDQARVHGLPFNEDEQAAPAGYLAAEAAAMLGKHSVVFLGGAPLPAVKRWEAGFKRGVDAYNEKHKNDQGFKRVSFASDYVGATDAGFQDKWAARRLAEFYLDFHQAGVVCQACGNASEGVLDAVRRTRMAGGEVFVISADWASATKPGTPPHGKPEDAVLFVVERAIETRIAKWVSRDCGESASSTILLRPVVRSAWPRYRRRFFGDAVSSKTDWQNDLENEWKLVPALR
jgi:simple sugar transport system permease protein